MALYKLDAIKKALQFGAVDKLILSKNLDKSTFKELKTMAENTGSNIEVVSVETDEGKQFENLSGVGAILRFKI